MVSPSVERRRGVTGGTEIKSPALIATTAAITLSGEQTIDGVLTDESRVMVKDQTDTTANGIYDTATGSWTRAIDANDSLDLVGGTEIYITSGTVNGSTSWRISGSGQIIIDTTAIVWVSSATYTTLSTTTVTATNVNTTNVTADLVTSTAIVASTGTFGDINVTGGVRAVQVLTLSSADNDHLSCSDGSTTPLLVAKPYLLQRTPFDGSTYNGVVYTYSAQGTRSAVTTSATETQTITPDYVSGDTIYAIRVESVTGSTAATTYLEIDQGRAWAYLTT